MTAESRRSQSGDGCGKRNLSQYVASIQGPQTSHHAEPTRNVKTEDFSSTSIPRSRSSHHKEYTICLKVTKKYGFLIRATVRDGETIFKGYSRTPKGEMGPAEKTLLFRNINDKILTIDGVCTCHRSMTLESFQRKMIRGARKGYVIMTVLDCSASDEDSDDGRPETKNGKRGGNVKRELF